MKIIKNNKGFTLLEMLLVLFIVIVISSIVFQFSLKFTEKRMIDQFLTQVQFDLLNMQALAIETGFAAALRFNDPRKYEAFQMDPLDGVYDFKNPIFEREYPPNIQFNFYSTIKFVHFNSKGETPNFGKLKFLTPYGEKTITINMQKGRLKFVE